MNCTVTGCTTGRRSPGAQYCEMHYGRMRRSGTLEARQQHKLTVCSVPDCGKPEKGSHFCSKHEARFRRHGSPHVAIRHRDRDMPSKESHWKWTGDDCSYAAAHLRLKKWRGSARKHSCIDCSGPAKQWAYNRKSPFELVEDGLPYSPRPEDYDPRCVPCHKIFDLRALGYKVRSQPLPVGEA